MSGGAFDYAYCGTGRFADELRNKLDEQGQSRDGYAEPILSPAVNKELRKIAAMAEHVSLLMKEAEWLYSGDTGEVTFLTRVGDIERDLNSVSAECGRLE